MKLGPNIAVELDGCELLYRDGSGARTLPADVREMLTAQTSMSPTIRPLRRGTG